MLCLYQQVEPIVHASPPAGNFTPGARAGTGDWDTVIVRTRANRKWYGFDL